MKHIFTNYVFYYVEESEKDCVISLEYDNDIKTDVYDWQKVDDNAQFHIMFKSDKNGKLDRGNIAIPYPHLKEYLGDDNCYEDYSWSVYAKARDWAEVNCGFLCSEV